ncbi:hypothetical protein K151_3049 [Proteus hauseri ZMd44]|nr:hypothetical protein K151_3049 [Proteus hauseri ZMd44]
MKVLHILGQLDIGGIECWLNDLIKKSSEISPEIHYTIIVDKAHIGNIEKNFLDLNVNVIHITPNTKSKIGYLKDIYKITKKENFDVIHSHVSFTSGIINAIAYINKIKIRISHIHSDRLLQIKKASLLKKIKAYTLLSFIELFSTHKIAVSSNAKNTFLNKKNSIVIPCGKDFSKIGLTGNINKNLVLWAKNHKILVSIGRLEKVKNHIFLLDLMEHLDKKFKLLIIGDGSERTNLAQIINNKNLSERVNLLGISNNCLNIMTTLGDIFVFPSLHEGLGMSTIEAQACGLPVICSSNVPKEVKLTNNVFFLPIEEKDKKLWINKILLLQDKKENIIEEIITGEYSIDNNFQKIHKIYSKHTY